MDMDGLKRCLEAAERRSRRRDLERWERERGPQPRCVTDRVEAVRAVADAAKALKSGESEPCRCQVFAQGGAPCSGASGRKPRVRDVFQFSGREFLLRQREQLPRHVRRALKKVLRCRTAKLGRHRWACAECDFEHRDYNSCRDRNCPGCRGSARMKCFEQTLATVLKAPHMQLIFTLPHELLDLIRYHQKPMYKLLLDCVRVVLQRFSRRGLKADVGFLQALHTWSSNLERHVHVHVLLTVGGLSDSGTEWIVPDGDPCAYDRAELSVDFRREFLEGMWELFLAGEISAKGAPRCDESGELLCAGGRMERLTALLHEKSWVIRYTPPIEGKGPDAIVKYLTQYLCGGPIGDRRIVSVTETHVTLWYKDYRDGSKQKTLTLTHVEFLERYSWHILPYGLRAARRGGLYAAQGHARLKQARALLGEEPAAPVEATTVEPESSDSLQQPEFKHPRCPRCKTTELLYGGELPGQRSTKPFTRLPTGDEDDKPVIAEALQDDDEALDAEGNACPSEELLDASSAELFATQPVIALTAHPPS